MLFVDIEVHELAFNDRRGGHIEAVSAENSDVGIAMVDNVQALRWWHRCWRWAVNYSSGSHSEVVFSDGFDISVAIIDRHHA